MPQPASELFIVDNTNSEWKVWSYLSEWCELSKAIDIATGYFEIGAFLCLQEKWQSVDQFRILMGDEVSLRTKRAFVDGLKNIHERLDQSLEREKAQNDFLSGVPAVVEAIRSGKILCRVYRKDKFHAKAYITHARAAVIGSYGLVGSSNFTYPGLCDNVELNVQLRGSEVGLLQDWYERHWSEAEDVTADVLRTLERHTLLRSPFEVWFKSLHEFFRGEALTPDQWDKNNSRMFPLLDKYQQDAYRSLLTIASEFNGAFLCDGVGLGKTFVGLMLLERMIIREKKRVVLFAPKAANEDVWEPAIATYLDDLNSGFQTLVRYNHTDLQRSNPDFLRKLELTLRDADVVLIDEAHHFRNPGVKGEGLGSDPSRYRKLQQFLHAGDTPKQMFFLTATPVNNTIHDFRHILELFTNGNEAYFAPRLGIHSLRSHFVQLDRQLSGRGPTAPIASLTLGPEIIETQKTLRRDSLFEALVVQRSRAYVKQSQIQQGATQALFPERDSPKVAEYDLKATYGNLLDLVERAFNKQKPLFILSIYDPSEYRLDNGEDPIPDFESGRLEQVVTLIRTLFLKRFESSARAFESSCWRLFKKLFAWTTVHSVTDHQKKILERQKRKHAALIEYVPDFQPDLFDDGDPDEEAEQFLSPELLDSIEPLNPSEYNIEHMLEDTFLDIDQLAEFLVETAKVKPERDDKLKALVKLLKTDPVLKREKVLLFTEFSDTARYIEQELKKAGILGVYRIDGSSSQAHRSGVIRRFSPYYNRSSSAELAREGQEEIRVLISTDVLAEGLNLQDATRLINYDIHWNPVRLMQRIGRVDRRMNPKIEAALIAAHPERQSLRGHVEFWNFLPPAELDNLLRLFNRVTTKTLVISRVLGIEGRQLLTPTDEFDPIKELNEQYDGTLSESEGLRLEYNKLMIDHVEFAQQLDELPLKLFSGKTSPHPDSKGVFLCYRIPRPDSTTIATSTGEPRWSETAGITVWLCYDLQGKSFLTDPARIANLVRSDSDTVRKTSIAQTTLLEVRKKADKQLTIDYLRPLQAPIGIAPVLKCWMELN
jgi:superfamily II DNA or RNA helicase